MNVANMDVAGLAGRLVQYARELMLSQSARQVEFSIHDRERCTTFLDRIILYIDAVCKPSNPLDLPRSHPTMHPCTVFPADEELHAIENALIMDLLCRFKAGWVEIVGSQSKDRASGILPADIGRMKALVENCRLFIELGETTMDLPENPGDVAAV